MLDLAFLVLMVIVLVLAMHGKFKRWLCIVTMIMGIAVALTGIVGAFVNNNTILLVLSIVVLVFAALLKKMAMRFVTLYEDKERERFEKLHEIKNCRDRENEEKLSSYYNEENFDDPELRFGKGGWTDNEL